MLRYLVDDWADKQPDAVYAVFEDGSSWTYAELRDLVVTKAAGLQKLGVKRGEHVAVWMQNGGEALVTFYAINYL